MAGGLFGWGVRPRPEELKRLLAEDVHVRVFTRERDASDAGRPYVELWNTARQPDGKLLVGGLFTALLLLRQGWDVHIFERSEVELSGRGAGIARCFDCRPC